MNAEKEWEHGQRSLIELGKIGPPRMSQGHDGYATKTRSRRPINSILI
jgi:hypothetical protein